MSVRSASLSPLQMAANGQADETRMPKGHCRYILLHPEIKGQRCACAGFSLNQDIPGATCACGHLACFHNTEPEVSADQKHEVELLKRRLQRLEDQLSKGQEDVLDSVVSRLNEVEEHLEKSKEEVSEQIKGAYRNVSMSWRSIEQAERRSQQQDEQLRQIYDKLRDHDEQLDRVHAGQLELRDADLSLEERIENLTETLEEEEELRLSAALAVRPPRRRSTSDTSRPNVPLGPLGAGAAHLHPYPSPTGGPITTNPLQEHGDGTGRDARRSTRHPQHHHSPRPSASPRAPSTGPWTVHISLLPHAYVPMPFERNTTAYQRCLSRGLHRMVAVQGRDAASFKQAVEKAFGQFLRGREWMPLQAKLCDAATLQGLPMLRRLDDPRHHQRHLLGGAPGCDHEFLRRHCAVVDPHGVIDSLYIAMRRHTISWHTLRHAPVFMDGLEKCWAHDALLDTDPFDDADMAVDDEDRPAAGDLTTALPVVAAAGVGVGVVAGLKRPLTEMSRSNSFSSSGTGTVGSVAAAAAMPVVPGEVVGDEARVKRTCPAPPSSGPPPPGPGPIVEIRRRDTIKTA
ncbi:hypothetical protein C8A01DRAFT_50063 [Parachaetomium inaequale]|uniref:Uncharacterized protein n=1 Tax=Parachaetomium inaequale TaxID=2588326 RepID=A0AAN6SM02_9PEZI|nr:hypothetical protein C8A01DRAFT_50063 [Parachaetomium inaequale]